MRSYIMMLVGASLVTGMLLVLCPKKHQKYLRLLCGFCMIAILVAPLPSYYEAMDEMLSFSEGEYGENGVSNYDEFYQNALCDASEKQMEIWLKSQFFNRYSLHEEDLSATVLLERDGDKVTVKKTILYISGRALLIDPAEMISFVEQTLFCPCEIIYGDVEK